MSIAIGLLGNLIAAIGLIFLFRPDFIRQSLLVMEEGQRLLVAALLRVGLGAFLVYAAPATGQSQVIWIIGLVMIVAGLAGLLMGRERLVRMVRWVVGHGDAVLRLGALLMITFGVLLWWAR